MLEKISSGDRIIAIQRLTALWALNECGLGGVLHAIQSPFTGLLVGSIAMTCIALICSLAEDKWKAVMTSLAIVLIIKALVSPHSSPAAFMAVIFQAVTGAIIYRFVPGLFLSSLLYVTIGLLESAFQLLLTLTILYGNTLWEAIDLWGVHVSELWGLMLPASSSQIIIYSYITIHLLTGLFMGWFVYRTIRAVHRHWGESKYHLQLEGSDKKNLFTANEKRGRNWKRYVLFLVLLLLILLVYMINDHAKNTYKGLISILRALVILTLWFVFLAPFVLKVLRKWLDRQHQQLSDQVAHTMDMIPRIAWIIDKAWKETKGLRFFERWKSFTLLSVLYCLQFKLSNDPAPDRPDT